MAGGSGGSSSGGDSSSSTTASSGNGASAGSGVGTPAAGTNTGSSTMAGGINSNGPSFSNAQDTGRIKNTINKSRAEQTSKRRGVTENTGGNGDKPNKIGKPSELQKDGLKKPEEGKKKKKGLKGFFSDGNDDADKSTEATEDEESKGLLGRLKKGSKIKQIIKKVKLYLIGAGAGITMFIIVFIISLFASFTGATLAEEDGDTVYMSGFYGARGVNGSTVAIALRELNDWNSSKDYCGMISKYMESSGCGYRPGEYCAAFVTYCLRESGNFDKLGIDTNVTCNVGKFEPEHMHKGVTHPADGSYIPQPGDLVIYKLDGGDYAHIEIVEKSEGNTVYLIGGNTGTSRSFCGKGEMKQKSTKINSPWLSHYISY